MAITSFRHKGLKELFYKGKSKHVGSRYHKNLLLVLDFLDAISSPDDCVGVKKFHQLSGSRAGTYSMHVTGNYRVTFAYDGEHVIEVDFEDYH